MRVPLLALDLSGTPLPPRTLTALRRAADGLGPGLCVLRCLRLAGCGLGAPALAALARTPALTSQLERLDLSDNPGLSVAGAWGWGWGWGPVGVPHPFRPSAHACCSPPSHQTQPQTPAPGLNFCSAPAPPWPT